MIVVYVESALYDTSTVLPSVVFFFSCNPDLCFMVISLTTHDKIKPVNKGPPEKFLDIRQVDQSLEDYVEDFMGMARQLATEKTSLMVIFWGSLADPFKSMVPYWAPEESLEEYVNLDLHLSGSAFRVESAPEPAPFGEPTESAPEPAPFGEPTESAPEPAPFREPKESAPFREPKESALFREATESAPALSAPPWNSGIKFQLVNL